MDIKSKEATGQPRTRRHNALDAVPPALCNNGDSVDGLQTLLYNYYFRQCHNAI